MSEKTNENENTKVNEVNPKAGGSVEPSKPDDSNQAVKSVEELTAEIDRLRKHSETVLSEKKKLEESYKSLKSQTEEEKVKKLKEKMDFEALYKLTESKLQEYEAREAQRLENEERELQTRLAEKFIDQLEETLGTKFHDRRVAKKELNFKDIVLDPKTGKIHDQAVKLEADRIMKEKLNFLLIPKASVVEDKKAQPVNGKKLSIAEKLSKVL